MLDTRGLTIETVGLQKLTAPTAPFTPTRHQLGPVDRILGSRLTIDLTPEVNQVRIGYRTAPSASALQWLEPSLTAGKARPFLFTQSEAIHARSWVPLQDSPGVRINYTATIRVPRGLTAVMAAESRVQPDEARQGVFRFVMPQAIPPYLMALAVGDLAFATLGERTGVWAEPSVLESAAYEFGDVEAMVGSIEKRFGPYRWGRYDILVLPPSFPFGGMENPLLTFATPTVLAGDRSLVSLIAHELAHSWSGNLVTNATWRDFWLNEGFTTYLERRIVEDLYGADRAEMECCNPRWRTFPRRRKTGSWFLAVDRVERRGLLVRLGTALTESSWPSAPRKEPRAGTIASGRRESAWRCGPPGEPAPPRIDR